MKKLLKYSAYGLGVLISIILIVLAMVAATFNPNDYKQQIIDLVQAKKSRTLKLEGDIKLSFWPKIGANLGKISLSEHNNSAEFASVESIKVSLALLPLLKKELIVDTIYINGSHANIIKYKDGNTNIDDLISPDDEKSPDIKFDIEGINISNSAANYKDEATGAQYSLAKLNVKSGHVTLAQPVDLVTDFTISANQPQIAASVKVKGNFLVDTITKHYVVKGLDATINGDLLGGKSVDIVATGNVDAKPDNGEILVDRLKLVASGQFSGAIMTLDLSAPSLIVQKNEVSSKIVSVSLTQEKAGDTFKANLVLADVKGSAKALQSSGFNGDISAMQGKRTINGQFYSSFIGNLESLIFDLPKLAGKLDVKDPSLPNGGKQGSFNLSLHADIKNESANSKFNLNIDETNLNGEVSITNITAPNIKFNLNADKLNLNKLLAKNSAPAKSNNKPTDLGALKTLLVDGKLNVGSLLYDNYRIYGLNVNIKADGEKLLLSGLNVKVDDSQIKGLVGISQFTKPLYTFNLDIDQLDVDKYVTASSTSADKNHTDKPIDLTVLKALNADGSLRIGKLKYGKTKASNIRIDLKADGEKVNLNPLSAKADDSQISANVGISRFNDPVYTFDINIDKLDADKYITKSEQPAVKNTGDMPIDLSALKKLNASDEVKIGWLKLANVKTEHVNLGLKAENGIATLSPFSADLYQGHMNGMFKVDARATPSITFKQSMKSIAIGPLIVDAINNDMLDGKGTLNIDISTTGNSLGALKNLWPVMPHLA